MTSTDQTPCAIAYDRRYCPARQTIARCQLVDEVAVRGADGNDISSREFRERMSLTHRSYAVSQVVCRILNRQRPSQIFRPVVDPVAVVMGHLVKNAWRRAVKRFADKPVHLLGREFSTNSYVQLLVTIGCRLTENFSGEGSRCVVSAPHSSQTRKFIVRHPIESVPFLNMVHFFSNIGEPTWVQERIGWA